MNKILLPFIFTVLSLGSVNLAARERLLLLDKVAGVVNDSVFTLSEIQRIRKTLSIRREIAPFIYDKSKMSTDDILNLLQNNFIVKDKLSELGFVVRDDAVESRIHQTEKGLNLNREELLDFLKSKGITFNEYFDLIREAMEFRIFQQRIISPLVTITDQELKNLYYKMNVNNKALSFRYSAVNFTLPEKKVLKEDLPRLPAIFEKYKKTGNIPAIYSDVSTNDLGDVADEDLPPELSRVLRNTNEKTFSKIYIKDGTVHIFYILKKYLVQSSDFLSKRNIIYNKIFIERSQKISLNWFSRKSLDYYIVKNI